MRYDTPVSFVLEGKEEYDYSTGNSVAPIVNQTDILANVADTSPEMSNFLYGKLKNDAYLIIIPGSLTHAVSYMLMDGKKYTIDKTRRLRLMTTYWVSGGA